VYWVKVEVTDNGNGTSSAVVTGSRTPNFTNSFTGTKTYIEIPLIKRVTGEGVSPDAVFQFNAVQVRDINSTDPVPGGFRETAIVETFGDGDMGFGLRIVGLFSNPSEGTSYYHFIITEEQTNAAGWVYSAHEYWVTVEVINTATGTTAQIVNESGGRIFENIFIPTPVIPIELDEDDIPPDDDVPESAVIPPYIVFPTGVTPDNFPGFDFNGTQPNPDVPGGSNPNVPPVPREPGAQLVPVLVTTDADVEEIMFLELDDDGVPLGSWSWGDEEEWMFEDLEDWDVPLGGWDPTMPSTGEATSYQVQFFTGLLFISLGVVMKIGAKIKKRA
jgi:hypothetical protein